MIDKSKELKTSIQLINEKLHFTGSVPGQDPISIDYTPPLGDNLGYTSLEILLLSLSSCLGSTLLIFLRRMGKNIEQFEIHASGTRKQDHPTSFSKITLEIMITSSDVTDNDLQRLLKGPVETYCPVWDMLKGNVDIEVTSKIN